jgi:hypothetical protein
MLRRIVPPENEFKITAVTTLPYGLSGEFKTKLVGTQGRTNIFAYNNSKTASGECFWGDNTLTYQNGMPIPVGSIVEVLIPYNQNPYFCSLSGEVGDLRILEVS